MITLITGEPGNGKTALVVKMLTEVNDRPVFVMGIRDLQIPHEPVPPISEWTEHRPVPEDPSLTEAWFTFPPNALIVIDEAQKVYRPRASGSKVPDIVAAFETHRHTGVDFWLITQAPGLIDSNIRKLIAKHIHIRANFMGRRRYEWVGVGDPESKQSREIARSENYAPPKEVFGLYKSAEAHTKVRHKIPFYVYLFGAALLVAVVVAYRVYQRIAGTQGGTPPPALLDPTATRATSGSLSPAAHLSTPQYLETLKPRIEGYEHTAPAYDTVTQVTTAPVPAVCYLLRSDSGEDCRCQTQQGTRYATTDDVCRSIITNGFFNAYAPQAAPTVETHPAPPA